MNNPKHFILDVDGVMTDGGFLYSQRGKTYKVFGPHDNDGIKLLQPFIKIVFITADHRGFLISKQRLVTDMKQELLLVNELDRLDYLKSHYDLTNSIYMGDGIYDAKILKHCLFGIAPTSARIEAKNAAKFITPSRAGDGAVLDAALKILEVFFPVNYKTFMETL